MLTYANAFLPTAVLVAIAAVSTAALYGLAALWAVGGRGGWLTRVAPVALLLAALVPLGAYDLLIVFGTQVAFIVAWVTYGRWFRHFRNDCKAGASRMDGARAAVRQQWPHGPRFQMRDLLQAVLLAAAVLAIVRYAAPSVFSAGGLAKWPLWAAIGAIVGLIAIAAEWLIFGNTRWYVRVPALLLVAVVAVGGLWQLGGAGFPLAAACGITVLLLMSMARLTLWAVWRRDTIVTGDVAPEDQTPARVWSRHLSRVAMSAAALFCIAMLGSLYWMLLPPAMPSDVVPNPNGYDELVRAAKSLNWSAIPTQEYDLASVDACRALVRDNAATLSATREALAKPSRVPVKYDVTYVTVSIMPDVQVLRSLARALAAEAKLAAAEGRHADAADVYLDMLRVGQMTGNGGTLVHELVGIAVGGVGIHGMGPELAELDAAQLAALRQRLQTLVDTREPVEPILEREDALGSASFGWFYRLMIWSGNHMLQPATEAWFSARNRYDAHLQLIMTEAAVRQFILEHDAPPESLAALVPEYLSAVPQDPYGAGPLKYQPTVDGYRLYSVGSNGVDDGGQRVTYHDAVVGGKGDFFFDAAQEE